MPVTRTSNGLVEISGAALNTLQRNLPTAVFGLDKGAVCVWCVREGSWASAAGAAEFSITGLCEACFDSVDSASVPTLRWPHARLEREADDRGITPGNVELYLALMKAQRSIQMPPDVYVWVLRRLRAEPREPLLQRRAGEVAVWHSAISSGGLEIVFVPRDIEPCDDPELSRRLCDALAASAMGVILWRSPGGRAVVFEQVYADIFLAGQDGVTVTAMLAVVSAQSPDGRRVGFLQAIGPDIRLSEVSQSPCVEKLLELACDQAVGTVGTGLLGPAIERCLRVRSMGPVGILRVWVPMTLGPVRSDAFYPLYLGGSDRNRKE